MQRDILVVEDEEAIRELLGLALMRAGYQMREAEDANSAWLEINSRTPDLVVLDWMLPAGTSGVELARRMRRDERTSAIPIIMLTARTDEHDKIQGLEAGADDYVTKPFSPRELTARISAVLRRTGATGSNDVLETEGLRLDGSEHRVSCDGNSVNLGPTEFRLLHFFMTHPSRVYSRGQIIDHVWGNNVYIEERTVDVHIRRLRKALSTHGHDRLVQTVRGVGYRFSVRD